MGRIAETPETATFNPIADWELIFECDETGLIALVSSAQTLSGITESTRLIIRSLFLRAKDAPIRAAYERTLNELMPTSEDSQYCIEQARKQIIALLREIKKYRQLKATEKAGQEKAARAQKRVSDEERRSYEEAGPQTMMATADVNDKTASYDSFSDAPTPPAPEISEQEAHDIDKIFADEFCHFYFERFTVLIGNGNRAAMSGGNVPFVLSSEFITYFEGIIREHFIPNLLSKSRSLIKRISEQPVDRRREFVCKQFNDRVSRENLWEKWRAIWTELTGQQELPKKPQGGNKKSLLDTFKKKAKKRTFENQEMTPDEWEAKNLLVQSANKRARKLWAEICKKSDAYKAPIDTDNKLLMDMFARSKQGMEKHLTAMRQIVEQDPSYGRGLSNYARGKDIELPLLAVSFRNPELFITERQALKEMMKGRDAAEVRESYPLLARYLSDSF